MGGSSVPESPELSFLCSQGISTNQIAFPVFLRAFPPSPEVGVISLRRMAASKTQMSSDLVLLGI
jgi:hypothetical protein